MSESAPVKIDSSGQEAIERVVDAPTETIEELPYSFDEYFHISETVRVIQEGGHAFVALQFPDGLLWASTRVQERLQECLTQASLTTRLCILADTSYGSCCVDEIAAQHFRATLLVHYGHACLSEHSNRISVFYVFGKKPAKIDQFMTEHLSTVQSQIADQGDQAAEPQPGMFVFYDPVYHHQLEEIRSLHERDPRIAVCEIYETSITLPITTSCPPNTANVQECCSRNESTQEQGCCGGSGSCGDAEDETDYDTDIVPIRSLPQLGASREGVLEESQETLIFGRRAPQAINEPEKSFVFLWIGDSSSITLRNLKMRFNGSTHYIWDPEKERLEADRVLARALMQRYGLVERAKEADLIGIVVGTLGVAKYLDMVEYVKKIIHDAGKKYYLYVVGKINPYKLANFPEVDIFVLIACHENSAIDSRDFYKPIVTPFELQLALVRGKEWSGKYVPDFRDLLEEMKQHQDELEDEDPVDGEEEYTYSLWSATMVKNPKSRIHSSNTAGSSSDLAVRNENTQVIASASAEHYLKSTWQGLEQRIGETPVEKITEGLSGIPKQYESEPTQ